MKRWSILLALTVSAGAVVGMVADAPTGASQALPVCTPHWRVVAHSRSLALSDIVAVSPSDVWAVGGGERFFPPARPVIVHWDGRTVRRFKAFVPSGGEGGLSAVHAVARDDVWAVGADGPRPVVMHWDGHGWRRAALPRLRTPAYLVGVVAISRTDVWAVGGVGEYYGARPLVVHWDGHTWRRATLPRLRAEPGTALWAIDAASADDVSAVGASFLNPYHVESFGGLAMHWDGRRWREEPARESGSVLTAVDAVSAREVWMLAADYETGDDSLERWDGRRLHTIHTPGGLLDVAVAAPRNVWAVGRDGGPPLVVHWDGVRGRIVPTPFASFSEADLAAVSVLSPTDIWAAGRYLIGHYSC